MSSSGFFGFGMRRGSAWPLVLLLFSTWIALSAGCEPSRTTSPPSSRSQVEQPKLLLYCGAGIRPAAAEIAEEFRRRHGVLIECDYAGSEVLLSRIKLSGEGDFYMPGDVYYVDQAVEDGLVTSKKTACYFIPVILVRKGNPANLRSLADLTRPGVKVGLGDPEACAIGRKSSLIFAKNDIPEEDVERNVVFRSVTVNELGNQIKLGMLDAVIVWDAMAAYFADDADVVPIPLDQNIISTVAVGVLESSRHPELAQEFLDFVASDEGAAIFEKHHYVTELPRSGEQRPARSSRKEPRSRSGRVR